MSDETPAHVQTVTNHYTIAYPAHAPRESDPHYAAFNAYHRAHSKTAVCDVGRRLGFDQCADAKGGPMLDQPGHPGLELHHKILEFSLINEVNLAALEQDYPNLTDPDKVTAWAETDANFVWYCVTPDTPVLMAGGDWKSIQEVKSGDWIVGGDGFPDRVLTHTTKPYTGDVYQIGPTALTPTHRVATSIGWLPIGQVADQIRVCGSEMIRLVCIQDEVDWAIIRPIPVEVVHSLVSGQGTTQYLSRDYSVLHTSRRTQIAALGQARRSLTFIGARQGIEEDHSASVGAETGRDYSPIRAGDVIGSTLLTNKSRAHGWLSIDEPIRTLYSGLVHDLSIEHSHSFVAGGIVVHNCAKHHRGYGGVHHAAAADFEASLYVKGLIGGGT